MLVDERFEGDDTTLGEEAVLGLAASSMKIESGGRDDCARTVELRHVRLVLFPLAAVVVELVIVSRVIDVDLLLSELERARQVMVHSAYFMRTDANNGTYMEVSAAKVLLSRSLNSDHMSGDIPLLSRSTSLA